MRLVLNGYQLDHRQIKDLTRLDADYGRVCEPRAAPVAAGWDVRRDLIGHGPWLEPE